LLFALLATKLISLLGFGHWADADECVVGIMAKHIVDQGVHPLYFYGQTYGGGASIEAHTIALLYRLFGMSGYTLKLGALVYTLTGAVLVYALAVRLADRKTGLLSLAVYTTLPALIEWGLKVRGGYVPMLVLVPAILWAADRMFRRSGLDHVSAAAFLVLTGVGSWNMQSILPLVVLVVLGVGAFLIWHRRFAVLAGYGGYAGVGTIAAIGWRFRSGSGMTEQFVDFDPGTLIDRVFERLGTILTETLPDFFQPFLNDVVAGPTWPAPITLGLFVAALGVVIVQVRRNHIAAPARPMVTLLLIYVPFYLVCFALASPRLVLSPRYLFPLVPAVAVLGGIALAAVPRWIMVSAVTYLAGVFAFFNADLIRHPRLYEHRTFYDPADIRKLAQTLERLDIRFVRTTYIIEWRLLFETRERVIAVNLKKPVRYPPYIERLEEAVARKGTKLAYVFRKDGLWSKLFLDMSPQEFAQRHLDGRGLSYETVDADPYVLYVVRRGPAASTPPTK